MEINKITILGGYGRSGEEEPVARVDLVMGNMVSIVGPTGSGKTALINDIGLFANRSTPSRRQTLVNGSVFPEAGIIPSKNPIALITQHTNFLSDLPVRRFLELHAKIRQNGETKAIVDETISFANELTGEPIIVESAMTELSGGQTRALLIADAVVIGNSPIILLDEIENAGIDRIRALELLRRYKKIFIFVTHDLRITLLSDFRIVMSNGAMQKLIFTAEEERRVGEEIMKIDNLMLELRRRIRSGGALNIFELKERMTGIGYLPKEET